METQQTQQTNVNLVVTGAGYAGLLATVRLAGKLRHRPIKITLINASNTFVERVRLHQFVAGRALKQISLPKILQRTGVEFLQGYVTRIDPSNHTLTVQTEGGTHTVSYDYLLYALGSKADTDPVPGVRDYAYTLAATGPLSAEKLRERLLALNSTGGNMVVCGGGATGIEAAAEFAGTFPNIQVHLVTRGTVGAMWKAGGETVTEYIRHTLEEWGVTIHDRANVTEVRANEVCTDAGVLASDITLWTGGFVVPSLAREAGLTVNMRGQALIDPFLRSISHPDIFVVGDSAQPVEEPGAPFRMSAFMAVVTGAHGADCLSAILQGKTPKPLSYAFVGQGIALGPHKAIGFLNYPDDRPRHPYFTGRAGYEVREFFVRYLASVVPFETRWPGFFFWLGKGRYVASKRHAQQKAQLDT